jgi:rod shape-determining protein RodA
MPWSLVVCALALLALGLTGIARAEELSGGDGRNVRRQVVWAVLSIIAMFAATIPNYRMLQRWTYGLFFASLPLLVAVFYFPAVNGAHCWIRLGPARLQPSELVKIVYVLAIARFLMYRRSYRELWGLVCPFALTLVPVALILKEPDLGTALVFLPVLFVMLFAAGARLRHLGLVALLGMSLTPVLWTQMTREQQSRITSLFEQVSPGDRPSDAGYQLQQSKQVLALGGMLGGEWRGRVTENPTAYRLPEARTDFVFSMIGERWGFVGGAGTLLLFLAFFARGLKVAADTREPFGRLVAVGIVAVFGVQAVVNTAMTVGLMPTTGITLPLLSYGGSSLLTSFTGIGLLLNIGMRPGYEITREPFRFRES